MKIKTNKRLRETFARLNQNRQMLSSKFFAEGKVWYILQQVIQTDWKTETYTSSKHSVYYNLADVNTISFYLLIYMDVVLLTL